MREDRSKMSKERGLTDQISVDWWKFENILSSIQTQWYLDKECMKEKNHWVS